MAIIGLISDTHDHQKAVDEAIKIFRENKVELILHAGDWIAPFTLKRLAQGGIPVIGVFGNNDGEKKYMRELAAKYYVKLEEEVAVIKYDNVKIALTHGTHYVIVDALVKSKMFDIVVYGHTHSRDVKNIDGTLVINPGEACGYLTGEATIALLNLKTREVQFISLNV